LRADEAIADPEAASAGDGVPQRDRPVMLEENESRGRVVRDLLEDIPSLLIGEALHPIGGRLGAQNRPLLGSFFALDAKTDERADLAAELDRLVLGQVAEMLHLYFPVGILVHRERVDHAHSALVMEPLELGDDLPVKLGLCEAYDDQLDRSDGHGYDLSEAAC
jgi:hypothetical protein